AGYDVAVHYRSSREDAEKVASEIATQFGVKTAAIGADLSKEAETASLVSKASSALGRLSALINSASLFEYDEIASMTRGSWDAHIEPNLRAPIKLIQDFAVQAEAGDGPSIVNFVDQRVFKLTPQFFSYTTTKAALHAATTTLAQALGPKGVRVNAIAPGPILKNARQSDEDWRRQNEATILGHGATPDEICQAVNFLLSAKSVTGQTIAVDGGQHLAWRTPDVLVNE
ncbi:MAG: SDR family oxidoreductase, partial [Pseudomonadota bacterium]